MGLVVLLLGVGGRRRVKMLLIALSAAVKKIAEPS